MLRPISAPRFAAVRPISAPRLAAVRPSSDPFDPDVPHRPVDSLRSPHLSHSTPFGGSGFSGSLNLAGASVERALARRVGDHLEAAEDQAARHRERRGDAQRGAARPAPPGAAAASPRRRFRAARRRPPRRARALVRGTRRAARRVRGPRRSPRRTAPRGGGSGSGSTAASARARRAVRARPGSRPRAPPPVPAPRRCRRPWRAWRGRRARTSGAGARRGRRSRNRPRAPHGPTGSLRPATRRPRASDLLVRPRQPLAALVHEHPPVPQPEEGSANRGGPVTTGRPAPVFGGSHFGAGLPVDRRRRLDRLGDHAS